MLETKLSKGILSPYTTPLWQLDSICVNDYHCHRPNIVLDPYDCYQSTAAKNRRLQKFQDQSSD